MPNSDGESPGMTAARTFRTVIGPSWSFLIRKISWVAVRPSAMT